MAEKLLLPSWMTDKKMHWDDPWSLSLRRTDMGELWNAVIKNYQVDTTKQYARFMVHGWMGERTDTQWRDSGDEYCRGVYQGALIEVLGVPATQDQIDEWDTLRMRSSSHEDPFVAMGF